MKNASKIIFGLSYVVIAAASLLVILFWPHKQQTKTLDANTIEAISINSKEYGLLKPWLEIQTENDSPSLTIQTPNVDQTVTADRPAFKEQKKYSAQNLLINLITWAVFLTLVTFGFKALLRIESK